MRRVTTKKTDDTIDVNPYLGFYKKRGIYRH